MKCGVGRVMWEMRYGNCEVWGAGCCCVELKCGVWGGECEVYGV